MDIAITYGLGALPCPSKLDRGYRRHRIGGSHTFLFYDGVTLMDIMSALNAAGHAVGLIRTATQTLDEAKIVSATNELNAQLIQLGAEVIAMQKDGVQATERERASLARMHQLEQRIRQLEERNAERERYELAEPCSGSFTLRVKESARGTEPVHHVCPGCFDNKALKYVLQAQSSTKGISHCPACNTAYRMRNTAQRPIQAEMD